MKNKTNTYKSGNIYMYYLINVKLSFVLDLVFSSSRQGLTLSWLVSSLWCINLSFLRAEPSRCVLPNVTPLYLLYDSMVSSLRKAINRLLNPTFHCSLLFWCLLYPASTCKHVISCCSQCGKYQCGKQCPTVLPLLTQTLPDYFVQQFPSYYANFWPSTTCICIHMCTHTDTLYKL